MEQDDRNPLLIPGVQESTIRRGCPKCKHPDFNGRKIQGVITFTCAKCANKWQGGLPHEPQDSTLPTPPLNPANEPSVQFFKDKYGQVQEIRRPISTVPAFRKGLPVTESEE